MLRQDERYLPEIDRLRGLAILYVLFHHVFGQPYGLWGDSVPITFTETWTGVDLFFVISGFVVYRAMREEGGMLISARAFYRRRFWRIAPLAVLCSLVPVGLLFLSHRFTPTSKPQFLLDDLLGIYTLSYNYVLPYAAHSSFLLAPYWSLCVEEHFYLVLPLLLLVLRGRWAILLFGSGVFMLTPPLRALVAELTHPANFPLYLRTCTHCRLDGLFLGVMIGELERMRMTAERGWKRAPRFLFWVLASALVLTPNLIVSPLAHNLTLSLNALISAGLVYMASKNRGWIPRLPGLEAVGRLSYSLYLVHLPVLYFCVILFGASGRDPTFSERAAITVCFSLILGALAMVTHTWVERPLRKWGRKRPERTLAYGL